jgi:tetratricopeptide (TPR) repeat protein
MLAFLQGKYAEAQPWFEENLAMCRQSGNMWGVGVALLFLGLVAHAQGNYAGASHYMEGSLAIFRELGVTWGIAGSLNFLALATLNQGEYGRAGAYVKEGLAVSREYDLKLGIALALCIHGLIVLCQGEYEEALPYLEQSLVLNRERGDKLDQSLVLSSLGLSYASQGEAAEARRCYAESLGLSLALRHGLQFSHSLTGLAGLASQGWLKMEPEAGSNSLAQLTKVARLSGAVSALLTSWRAVMVRPFQLLYEQNLALARGHLAPASFEAAFAEGQALSMAEAAAAALAE